MNSYNYLFKFIIVGDTNVGKSCLLLQYVEKRFRSQHDATIGVEFGAKTIDVNAKSIKVQIWDTAGQESFKSITRSYYRGSIGVILVYDITKRESYDNIQKWMQDIQNYSNDQIQIVLVGNKCDMPTDRKVEYKEGQDMANSYNIEFFEVSAKENTNVDLVFSSLCSKVLKKIEKGEITPNNEIQGVKLGQKGKVEIKNNGISTLNNEQKAQQEIKQDGQAKKNCC